MSHKGLDERVLIEIARGPGSDHGRGRFSYGRLQQELRSFVGMSFAEVCEYGLDVNLETWISNGMAANVFRNAGYSLDRLTPLQRFLRSRVGLDWNSVQTEIRTKIKGRGDSVRHVLGHVYDYVELNPVWIDGVVHQNPGDGYSVRPLREWEFYVNPDGILCNVPPCCVIDSWRRTPKPEFESALLNGEKFLLIDRKDWRMSWARVEEFGWYLVGMKSTYSKRLLLKPDGTPQWDACGDPLTELYESSVESEVLRKASSKEVAALEKLRNTKGKAKRKKASLRRVKF